jgi:hypothetical protein
MPPRRKVNRFSTPLPELVPKDGEELAQLSTPQRSAVFAVAYFIQKKDLTLGLADIREVFNIPERTSRRTIQSGRCRRLQDSDEPETRGVLRRLTASNANAIGTHIDSAPFEEKGKGWCCEREWRKLCHRYNPTSCHS